MMGGSNYVSGLVRYLTSASVLVAAVAPVQAAGDLLVAPTRVVLNGNQGTEVILSNIGSEAATYRVTLELRRMSPSGELEDVDVETASAAEKAAAEMIRYAPRRIMLPPNQPQSIRISARPASELPDGEYRVHMAFRAVPAPKPASTTPATAGEAFSVQLTPVYGVTIPVIVRKGQLEATVAISNPRVVRDADGALFSLDMARSGNRSVYGEIAVIARGSSEPVFHARGVALYPELAQRALLLPVTPEQAAKMRGPVRVEYRETPEAGGRIISAVEADLG